MIQGHWSDIWAAIKYFFGLLFVRQEDAANHPVNDPVVSLIPISIPSLPKYLWSTKEECRHSIRLICDEEGLNLKQKNDLTATLHCESNWNPACIHQNVVNGKVTSADFGIAQINDYFHIGKFKDFPSTDYVLNNPEACVRWTARQWKAGNAKLWVCYSKGLYTSYAS